MGHLAEQLLQAYGVGIYSFGILAFTFYSLELSHCKCPDVDGTLIQNTDFIIYGLVGS